MNDDDLTTHLGRELHTRSEAMHGSSLALADVQHRARSIRRRRSAAAVTGAALALALVVPVASLVNHHGRTNDPLPAVTQSVSPDPTPSPTGGQQPPAGVLDVADLPTGTAPRTEYVTGARTLHLVDGGSVDLPTRYPIDGFVALQDGTHVFQTNDNGRSYVEVEDSDGGLLPPVRSEWGLAVNEAHTSAGWVTPDGQVFVLNVGDAAASALGDPVGEGYSRTVAAVVGDCAAACRVYVNVSAQDSRSTWEVTDAGSHVLSGTGFQGITDATEAGSMIGFTRITDNGSCSKFVGTGVADVLGFSTCRAALESFSPDGTTILADPPYFDGLGPTSLSMWSLDGKRLFERQAGVQHQAFLATHTWEDATHLLVTAYQGGKWSIVRVGTDGSMEYAVPPRSGDDVDSPFVLPS